MGSIGELVPSSAELPTWAEELLKRPLIEIRRGISLGYDPPYEDSSVIVLTAPSGKYVDIRFSLLPQSQAARMIKNPGKIWGYATAGLSTAIIQPGIGDCPAYNCMAHVTWEHSIDSSDSFETDGADIYLLANGDRMEVGIMLIHDKMQLFKEYWISPAESPTEPVYVVVEFEGETNDKVEQARGMAIRIGNYCQGILQDGDKFWYERWEFHEHKQSWVMNPRSNTSSKDIGIVLPCSWILENTKRLGDTVELDSGRWMVNEISGTI